MMMEHMKIWGKNWPEKRQNTGHLLRMKGRTTTFGNFKQFTQRSILFCFYTYSLSNISGTYFYNVHIKPEAFYNKSLKVS